MNRSWSGGGMTPVHVEMTYQNRDGLLQLDRFIDDPLGGASMLAVQAKMDYAPTHELTGLTYSNGSGVMLADYAYTFDNARQLTSQVENGESTDFTYDLRGNLTKANHATRPDETFNWDANGNPNQSGAVVESDNRVTSDGTRTFEYDDEGNRTKSTCGAPNCRRTIAKLTV